MRCMRNLAASCPQLQTLDHAQTLAMLPCLRPEQVYASLVDPLSMDIDVNALHQGFLRMLRRSGGELRTRAEVSTARLQNGQWQLTLADGNRLQAAVVVNAAGAWADQLGQCFGARSIGLVPHRRSAFTFHPPEGMVIADWPVVSNLDESWYFKPDAGVLLGSPANADPTVPHDVAPEELDIATAIHHIEASHPSADSPADPNLGRFAFLCARRRTRHRMGPIAKGNVLACRPGWIRHTERARSIGAGCFAAAGPATARVIARTRREYRCRVAAAPDLSGYQPRLQPPWGWVQRRNVKND